MTGNTAFALAPDHSAGGEVEYAEVAGYAATAGSAQSATEAVHAVSSDNSTNAENAQYAVESSSADTAEALNSEYDAGNATTPVYFENGLPKAISYSIGKTVPSNAKFTDTTYTAGDHISIKPSNEISVEGLSEYAAGSHVSFTQDSPSSPYKINATWRGIQNNLTSTSTTDSLSANMGKKLNDEKLALSGGTMTGNINMGAKSITNIAALAGGTNGMNVTNVARIDQNNTTQWLNIQCTALGVLTDVTGPTYAEVNAKKFNTQSSIKYKENIDDMSDEYAKKLLELRPVSYDYKNKAQGTNCYGLIAEEVVEVETFPVSYKDGEVEGLDYSTFVPQLIKLAQIQDETIKMLENRIKALEEAK